MLQTEAILSPLVPERWHQVNLQPTYNARVISKKYTFVTEGFEVHDVRREALHPCSLCLHEGEGVSSILQEENNVVDILPAFLHPPPFLLEDMYLTCLVMWEREMA